MTVLIPEKISDSGIEYLRKLGYELLIGVDTSEASLIQEIQGKSAMLLRIADIPNSVLEAGSQLKVVARHGVGYDNIDVDKAEELGIWVTNTPEANASTVAEFTIGLMLSLGRRYMQLDSASRSGDFAARSRIVGIDFENKTLGIVGMGRIGSGVARRGAKGLGMNIVAFDPYLKTEAEGVVWVDSLEALLVKSDIVSLHVPLTEETARLIGAKELALMKPTSYLINTSRGEVVVEEALIDALKSGKIAGAGLDVYEKEPPDPDNRLFGLDNVVVTPHTASLTAECKARMALHAAQSIHEVLSGKKPSWPVNNPLSPR